MKKLKVVFATSTLALGINAPCKTVVLAHDSTWLNGINKNQMEGRAGRRGFDLVGYVVYFGIPHEKIKRLLNSDLPDLISSVPIDPTTYVAMTTCHMKLVF